MIRSLKLPALALAAILLSMAAFAESAGRVVTINNRVTVSGGKVLLGDLAANPAILTDEEKQLAILDSPAKGSLQYTLISLAYSMQKYPELHSLKITGPRRVTVEKVRDTDHLDRLKAQIVKFFKKTSPWDQWEINVQFSNDDERKISRMIDSESLKILTYDSSESVDTVRLRVQFLDENNKTVGKETLKPMIMRKTTTILVKNNLAHGHILTEDDLYTASSWVRSGSAVYVDDMKKCLGFELRLDCSAGHRLKFANLIQPVSVNKGEILWVAIAAGNLTVKVAAKALKQGRRGETIKVANVTSGKLIDVVLTGRKDAKFK